MVSRCQHASDLCVDHRHSLVRLLLCLLLLQVSEFPLGVIFSVCSVFLAIAAGELQGFFPCTLFWRLTARPSVAASPLRYAWGANTTCGGFICYSWCYMLCVCYSCIGGVGNLAWL
jgi:hypothetical protein